MSESTTAVLDVDATVATPPAPVAEAPVVPTSDTNVKIADLPTRAVELLTVATKHRNLRGDLDTRATDALVRHLVSKFEEDQLTDTHVVETLPAYGQSGVGSLRYTKQRAQLLIGIAKAFSVEAELTYTKYTYPNPNTGRRNYQVHLWGAKVDIDRTLAAFRAFQARGLTDAYTAEVCPMPSDKPAEQTKARREWFVGFADQVAQMLGTAVEAKAKGKTEAALSDRATAAEASASAWRIANAATGTEVIEDAKS